MERRTKLNLSDKDIYINIVGGLKSSMTKAADLAYLYGSALVCCGRRMDDGNGCLW
jgi:DNA repair protein RadA/Sms